MSCHRLHPKKKKAADSERMERVMGTKMNGEIGRKSSAGR